MESKFNARQNAARTCRRVRPCCQRGTDPERSETGVNMSVVTSCGLILCQHAAVSRCPGMCDVCVGSSEQGLNWWTLTKADCPLSCDGASSSPSKADASKSPGGLSLTDNPWVSTTTSALPRSASYQSSLQSALASLCRFTSQFFL